MLSLLTASKFLLIDLHACLQAPRHGPRTNITTQQNFSLELHPREQCHLFQRVGVGGHASGNFITKHCGLLNELQPGDLVLADRGLDIEDSAFEKAFYQTESSTKW